MRRLALVVLFASGCGRFGFDPFGDDTTDAGAASDARIVDARPGTFCGDLTPAPLFCDDFDAGDTSPWSEIIVDNATIGEENGALVVRTDALPGTKDVARAIWRHDVATANAVTVAFDVNPITYSINDPVLVELVFGTGGGDQHFFEWVHKLDGVAYVEEIVSRPATTGDNYYYYSTAQNVTPGPHRIAMSFDPANVGSEVKVDIDGINVITHASMDSQTGVFYVNTGVPFFSGPSGAWEIALDNFVVTSP